MFTFRGVRAYFKYDIFTVFLKYFDFHFKPRFDIRQAKYQNLLAKIKSVKSAAVFKKEKKIENFLTLGLLTPPFHSSDISDGFENWIFNGFDSQNSHHILIVNPNAVGIRNCRTQILKLKLKS